MKEIEKYDVICIDNGYNYIFFSVGNKGLIRKAAQFTESSINRIYQFRFGDVNNYTEEIDDNAVSNNNDTIKVLNTIVWILYDFISKKPNCLVRLSGITYSRTRLFSLWLTSNWDYANKIFVLFGSKSDEIWEKYRYGTHYNAIIIKKRIEIKTEKEK